MKNLIKYLFTRKAIVKDHDQKTVETETVTTKNGDCYPPSRNTKKKFGSYYDTY